MCGREETVLGAMGVSFIYMVGCVLLQQKRGKKKLFVLGLVLGSR